MLAIRKTAIFFDERDLIEVETIVTDNDEKEVLRFTKKSIYDRISHAQQSRLKSHLDGGGDPVRRFEESK